MKAVKRMALSVGLNATAAAAGLLGTTLIVWYLGLAVFGGYAVDLAKLSLIMLASELLPGSYAQFRIQDDERFAKATPTFYLLFGLAAVAVAAAMIEASVFNTGSWFMLAYLLGLCLQRCFDGQILAQGAVDLSVSVPVVTNLVRAGILALLLATTGISVADMLWGSLAAGTLASQILLMARRPEFFRLIARSRPIQSLCYLWSLRRDYAGYYLNSVLKRAKDTLFPLFCDLVLPSKAELGKLLVFTRATDTVAGQVRVLELFLIHRQTRANLAKARRRILLGSAALGHVAVVGVSAFLLWKEGPSATSLLYAAAMGLFMYPYAYELARRSDAYARNAPHLVTVSLVAFIVTLAASLSIASLLQLLWPPVLIGCIVLAQTVSAIVYLLRDPRVRARLGATRQ